MNVDEHDGRRTAVALVGSAVIGLAAVGATFWVLTGAMSSSAVRASQAIMATSASIDAATPDVQTTSTTSIVVPSPTVVPFTSASVNVAPPELPTMTAPGAGAAADPEPAAAPPPGVPTTAQPPPATSPPAISEVSMSCRKNGNQVEGGLTFRTTTAVSVSLMAGGKVEQQHAAGPGVVSITAAGKRGSFCMATVGSQRFGPMPAS